MVDNINIKNNCRNVSQGSQPTGHTGTFHVTSYSDIYCTVINASVQLKIFPRRAYIYVNRSTFPKGRLHVWIRYQDVNRYQNVLLKLDVILTDKACDGVDT